MVAKASGNILFCGVGGQGILLASEITASALLHAGYDVKKSEVHGMAQRGGSVEAHLRFGPKVYSPLIEPGTADIAVSFELLEALRYMPYYGMHTRVVVNTQHIPPPTVARGLEGYPANVQGTLQKAGLEVYAIDAFSVARKLGEVRTANMVLVGALSRFLPVQEKVFLDIISARVPDRFRTVNLDAFTQGRELTRSGGQP